MGFQKEGRTLIRQKKFLQDAKKDAQRGKQKVKKERRRENSTLPPACREW